MRKQSKAYRGAFAAACAMTAAMAGLGLTATSAAAQSAADKSVVATFSKLDVSLTGRIMGGCAVAGGGDINFGELTGNETAVATLDLDCNVPFELGFSSPRGGLAHATMPQGQGPFAGTLPYSVRVEVPVISPQPSMLDRSFDSRDLRSRRTMNSGEAIAAGGARLTFKTDMPSGAGLLAGDYSETLTVTVTAL
jgi:spore coat protein U-like protein